MRRRSIVVLVLTSIVLAGMAHPASGGSSEPQGDEEILRAYMEAPGIATEIEKSRKRGYSDQGARAIQISLSCGVAGCSSEYLVVQFFSHGGTNPQGFSILARVQRDTRGEIQKVERVELAPSPGH